MASCNSCSNGILLFWLTNNFQCGKMMFRLGTTFSFDANEYQGQILIKCDIVEALGFSGQVPLGNVDSTESKVSTIDSLLSLKLPAASYLRGQRRRDA